MAAIDAGVSSIMPYYGVPINVTYEGVTYDQTGMAFSKQIVTDLLRGKLGFKGYVNSDTGIINDRAWGLEEQDRARARGRRHQRRHRHAVGLQRRTRPSPTWSTAGLVSEARVNEAAKRLLKEQFQLGLFENPYVDASKADGIIGRRVPRGRAWTCSASRSSCCKTRTRRAAARPLPLKAGAKVYTMGLDKADVAEVRLHRDRWRSRRDGKAPR